MKKEMTIFWIFFVLKQLFLLCNDGMYLIESAHCFLEKTAVCWKLVTYCLLI